MKLFEVKKTLPFGIYSYDKRPGMNGITYNPEQLVSLLPPIDRFSKLRPMILYSRTAKQLEDFIQQYHSEDPFETGNYAFIGPSKLVIQVGKNEYYWVNYNGKLTTWEEVKKHFDIFRTTKE